MPLLCTDVTSNKGKSLISSCLLKRQIWKFSKIPPTFVKNELPLIRSHYMLWRFKIQTVLEGWSTDLQWYNFRRPKWARVFAIKNFNDSIQNFCHTQIKNTCIDASFADLIWRPDLYFVDSREQRRHDVVTDNLFMEVQAQFDRKFHSKMTLTG